MTRVTVEDLARDEVPADPAPRLWRRKRRRQRRRLGCCLPFFVVLLFGLTVTSAVISATGAVYIPLLSELFYRLPTPGRVINVSPDVSNELAISVDRLAGTATVVVTESQLTVALRRGLAATDVLAVSTGQAVIRPEGIELFCLVVKPLRLNVSALVVPSVEAGRLALQVQRIMLGRLSIPPSWAASLVRFAFGNSFDPLVKSLSEVAVASINLSDGVLTATVPLDAAWLINSANLLQ